MNTDSISSTHLFISTFVSYNRQYDWLTDNGQKDFHHAAGYIVLQIDIYNAINYSPSNLPVHLHRVSKTNHLTFDHNFANVA